MNTLPDNFFVLDTETTGLDDNAEIVEIAIIDNYGEAALNTLIKPTQPIPDKATAIHGITDDMVADAPTWVDIYPTLSELVWDADVFIYNAAFDTRLWQQTSLHYSAQGIIPNPPKKRSGEIFYFTDHCVMKMAAERINHYHRVSLAKASEHYNITFDGLTAHRAASDCAVTLDVLRAMHGLPPVATGQFARQYEVTL